MNLLPIILLVGVVFFILYIIFGNTKCPNCNLKMPFFRHPTSFRQAIYGGWTCENCQCEMDKWGKAVTIHSKNHKAQNQFEEANENFIKSFDEKGKTPVERVFQDKS